MAQSSTSQAGTVGVEAQSAREPPGSLEWERARLQAATHGDRQAFAELYDAFAERLVVSVLLPRLGDLDAAYDALAETFRALLTHLGRVEIIDKSLWHWLAAVARNKAHDSHRRRQRRDRLARSFEQLMAPLWRGLQDPPPILGRVEILEGIERCLATLNPRYAEALTLRFLAEKSRQDCADTLEVTLGTFDVLLLRAARAFRQQWLALEQEVP